MRGNGPERGGGREGEGRKGVGKRRKREIREVEYCIKHVERIQGIDESEFKNLTIETSHAHTCTCTCKAIPKMHAESAYFHKISVEFRVHESYVGRHIFIQHQREHRSHCVHRSIPAERENKQENIQATY